MGESRFWQMCSMCAACRLARPLVPFVLLVIVCLGQIYSFPLHAGVWVVLKYTLCDVCFSPFSSVDSPRFTGLRVYAWSHVVQRRWSLVTANSGAPFLRNDCPSANAAELMLSLNQIEKRIQIVIQFWVFLCSCMLLSKLVLYGTIKLIQEQHQ